MNMLNKACEVRYPVEDISEKYNWSQPVLGPHLDMKCGTIHFLLTCKILSSRTHTGSCPPENIPPSKTSPGVEDAPQV